MNKNINSTDPVLTRPQKFFGALISGVLIGLAFPFPSSWQPLIAALVPVAFVPLFLVLCQTRRPRAFIFYAWICGFFAQSLGFFWISTPILFFTDIPDPLAYFFSFIIFGLTAFYFVFLLLPFFLFGAKSSGRVMSWYGILWRSVLIALAMTFLEMHLPGFFDWSFAGLMAPFLSLSQVSSWFGWNTTSLFIFFTSTVFSLTLMQKSLRMTFQSVVLCLLLWGCLVIYGWWRLNFKTPEIPWDSVEVVFVQPNYTFSGLASRALPTNDGYPRSLDDLLRLSDQALQASYAEGYRPRLLIWPESTGPDFLSRKLQEQKKIEDFAKFWNIDVLLQTIETPRPQRFWSTSLVMTPQGVAQPTYQKWIPMPLGEEFPLESYFPFLGEWYRQLVPNASKVERGESFQALPFGEAMARYGVGPLICFDALTQKVPYLETSRGKADILVNQANFVWMMQSSAGLKFSVINQFRAIENGRSALLAANTGPTIAFDPYGRPLMKATELLSRTSGSLRVPLNKEATLFSRVSHWPLTICGIIAWAVILVLKSRELIHERRVNAR